MNTTLRSLLGILVAALLAGCAGGGPLLNSERIERAFGSFGVEILQQDERRRESSLYSGSGDDRVMRTYAVAEFLGSPRSAYRPEHEAIVAGASIGETFRRAGWSIRKQNLFIGTLEVPATYAYVSERMEIELPTELALHQYLFVISKEERSFTYARITELHHPDYLDADDLNAIYGEIIFDDSNRDSIHDFLGPPREK